MSITPAATGTPINKPLGLFPFVDKATGQLSEYGLQLLTQWYNFIVGMNRLTPCNAAGKNLITLTPLTASPLIEKYVDYEIFSFVADQTSDGSVTGTVVPEKGALATIKVFKTNGSAQAGAGDVVAGSMYLGIYVDALDGGAGGLVIK